MNAPLLIQSRNNPRIKAVALLKDSKHRRNTGKFIVEGMHEVQIALEYKFPLETLFVSKDQEQLKFVKELPPETEIVLVTDSVFEKMSHRQNHDGILAVCIQKKIPPLVEFTNPSKPVLILDGLEKPGNHGAILRSASAFGISEVILNRGNLDPFNPNTIRNSRGHSLSFQHYKDTPEVTKEWLEQNQYTSFVASPEAEKNIGSLQLSKATAFILGSEHDGVSEFWKTNAHQLFKIPMTGNVDSLNVSVSASIVLYEIFKQSV